MPLGSAPLWASGGSQLILWLLLLMLVFVNAVYQDGSVRGDANAGYPRFAHGFISMALVILPIYSVFSYHGITQRASQYDWTVERCWSTTTRALLSRFGLVYTVAVLRLRSNWSTGMARISVALGLVVTFAMMAVNSPPLNFREIAVASQLARFERGDVSPGQFDFARLGYWLGRPGREALKQLAARYENGETLPATVTADDRQLEAPQ